MAGKLEGKVAIITGGASGMGAADARRFVAEGAKVVLTDLNVDAGEALAAELGENAVFMSHNVASEEDWQRVIAGTVEKFGRVDVLVNNAGILIMKSIEDTTLAEFEKIMQINVTGVFMGMQQVVPLMKAQGSGVIVNMSSAAGIVGQVNTIAYSASKFAVRGMTKAAAMDLGLAGIRVLSIHPGSIATPMTAASGVSEGGQLPLAALNRSGTADEVARVVAFAASDDAAYVTGTELVVDGGLTLGDTPQVYGMMAAMAQQQ
ncbi:glucose 1-dehydrogenase [Gulosibacter macacae]|uniref:Glucose 1-dehydrogenase n=1 Tax=Gulosibacter macacae TaxID=2488791 RepID=A0A3P3W1K6_9MICO|nr:glucose 1-dehydrogenase [Gulosibacter macacae]RRJ88664.1 glucose 1-dehydrogenase [Gulosibacter macacae]